MDVLMIGLTPPVEGGSQRHIYEISSEIKSQVLTQSGSICKNRIELPIICFNNLILNLSFFLACLIYSLKLLIIKKHDIIHIHENLLYLLAPILRLRYKVIITVHGITGFRFYESRFLWFFFKNSLKFANRIISVSLADQKLLKKELKNIVYIPNGVDIALYSRIQQRVQKKITFVGRVHEQKGTGYLLEAFSRISPEFPNFKLEIIGKKEGNLYEKLSRKYKNNKNILWKGFILNRKELFSEIASSYALVFPSLWEALPWPALLEGLASGRPVIASSLEGMDKIFENSRDILLIKPKDSDQIADKISLLIKNPRLAEKIGIKGKQTAREYSWREIAKKVEREYKNESA